MAQIADQIMAVVDYVKQQFPGHSVWDGKDHDRSAHTVSVWFNGDVLLLTASFEFLSDNTPSEVQKLLTRWTVADALREEAGPTKRVLVTRDGWKVTARRTPLFVALFLLAWAATASAECAWVMWEQWLASSSVVPLSFTRTGTSSELACRSELRKAIAGIEAQAPTPGQERRVDGDTVLFVIREGDSRVVTGIRNFLCLPDTVDPRGPKGK